MIYWVKFLVNFVLENKLALKNWAIKKTLNAPFLLLNACFKTIYLTNMANLPK